MELLARFLERRRSLMQWKLNGTRLKAFELWCGVVEMKF